MARKTSSNPLAEALDRRVRAVVEEAIEDALSGSLRDVIREELAAALGSTAAAPSPRRTGRGGGRRAAAPAREGGKTCNIVDCERAYRSQGYCAAHYQAARKYGWPMPAPANFTPPPRPPRGRPSREASAE